MTPPIDLEAAWWQHVDAVLAERDEPAELHASDLHSCRYALAARVSGAAQMPFDYETFSNFERGHAYEARVHDAILGYAIPRGFVVTRGETIVHEGIVGHLDFALYAVGYAPGDDDTCAAVIDCSTTAGKSAEWKWGHALKTAWYAIAKGAPMFAEIVLQIGFGGTIKAVKSYWFGLDDIAVGGLTWREMVGIAAADVRRFRPGAVQPLPIPPIDPLDGKLETWRCGKPGSGKSYCRAHCPNNARYVAWLEELAADTEQVF